VRRKGKREGEIILNLFQESWKKEKKIGKKPVFQEKLEQGKKKGKLSGVAKPIEQQIWKEGQTGNKNESAEQERRPNKNEGAGGREKGVGVPGKERNLLLGSVAAEICPGRRRKEIKIGEALQPILKAGPEIESRN
jgi:hypothetical protein